MPNIFSKININDSERKSYSENNTDITNIFYENTIKEDEEYYNSVMEFLRAVYTGNKDGIMSIIQEAFFDFDLDVKSKFFKGIDNIIDFSNNKTMFMCRNLISKYKQATIIDKNFNEFTIKGYKYTIDDFTEINYDIIDDIITKSEKYIDDVISEKNTPMVVTNWAYNDICSNEAYDKYRGIILGLSYVKEDEFRIELRAKFRDKKIDKIDIIVNRLTVRDIFKELHRLEMILLKMNKEKDRIKDMQRDIDRYSSKAKDLFDERDYRDIHDEEIGKYNRDKINAVATIYSSTTTALRLVYSMYIQYHTEKLNAITEAIYFYNKILNRVISQ